MGNMINGMFSSAWGFTFNGGVMNFSTWKKCAEKKSKIKVTTEQRLFIIKDAFLKLSKLFHIFERFFIYCLKNARKNLERN